MLISLVSMKLTTTQRMLHAQYHTTPVRFAPLGAVTAIAPIVTGMNGLESSQSLLTDPSLIGVCSRHYRTTHQALRPSLVTTIVTTSPHEYALFAHVMSNAARSRRDGLQATSWTALDYIYQETQDRSTCTRRHARGSSSAGRRRRHRAARLSHDEALYHVISRHSRPSIGEVRG